MFHEGGKRILADAPHRDAIPTGQPRENMSGQERDVVQAVAQRRDGESEHVETVEEVRAKAAFRNLRLQIAVGSREDPDVDAPWARVSHATKLPLLQYA
jgi:hypothetical protein